MTPADDTVAAELLVDGMVQGVGYRDFARGAARKLALRGYAMNLDDGRVRVVVEGPRAAIERLVGQLQRGPRLARVDGVSVEWREARREFPDFSIRHARPDR